jgi:hypothetical protein
MPDRTRRSGVRKEAVRVVAVVSFGNMVVKAVLFEEIGWIAASRGRSPSVNGVWDDAGRRGGGEPGRGV